MGDISFLGYKRIIGNTEIVGDLIISGSTTSTGAIKEGASSLVSFGALEKMVVTEETTSLLNFETITDSTGDVLIYEAL